MSSSQTVQVPAQYWRVWETAIQTIYQSMRISRHMIGPMMNKKDASWLQHVDESHILRNCGNHTFVQYPLIHSTRNVQKYTRTTWHATSIQSLNCYRVIKIYERNGHISTDGYKNTYETSQIISNNFRHIHEKFYSLTKTVISSWKAWKQNISSSKPKTHFN